MRSEDKQASPFLVIFALAMGGFAIGTTEFATMSLLPYFASSLHIDEPSAGHVISAYALGVVVGAPVIAVLAARMPRRTLLILLMAMFAVGNGLSALAPSYGWMMGFRFLSGLPHGAYFGIASMVASSLVPANKRTQAVGQVFLGLTVATIIGVPLGNWCGQAVGWRWSFAIVAFLALTALALVALFAPRDTPDPLSSPLRELGALRVGQVWLTLGIGAIGLAGYLPSTPILLQRSWRSPMFGRLCAACIMCLRDRSDGGQPCRAFGRGSRPYADGGRAVALDGCGSRVVHGGGRERLVGDACRFPDRHRRRACERTADAPDGHIRRGAGPSGRAQPFGIQYRQRARTLARRHCNHGRIRMDFNRLGGVPARALRLCHLACIGRNGTPSGISLKPAKRLSGTCHIPQF